MEMLECDQADDESPMSAEETTAPGQGATR